MKRALKIISIFIVMIIAVFAVAGCGKGETILCHLQFKNPDTNEWIDTDTLPTKPEIVLSYDGEQKTFDVRVVRDDNGKVVRVIDDIDISFTYKNPNTNKYEYDKPYIIEKGEYYLIVNSCSYDTEKYYISDTNKAEALTNRIE